MEVIFRSKQNIFSFCSRSSHRRCSVRNGVLRNFANFTGKHLCQSLFFNKVTGLRPQVTPSVAASEKYFVLKYLQTIAFSFYQKYSVEKCFLMSFLGAFFRPSYLSTSIQACLDVALIE